MSSNASFLGAGPVRSTELEQGDVLYAFDADQHAACLLRQLYLAQITDSSTCDVTLCTTDGHEVPFHAVLLAASSSVFRRRVAGDLFDVTTIKIRVPMELEVLEVIRDSIYTSKVTITPVNAGKVKDAAKRYKLHSLYRVCLQYEEGEGREDEEEEEEREEEDEDEDEDEEEDEDEDEDEEDDEAEAEGHQAKMLSKLRYLFNKEKLTTVTLQDESGNGSIRCHGALLAATSPVFQKMLSCKSSDQRTATFRLKEMTEDALQDIIHDFVYTAKVTIGDDNVVALLRAACRYQLPGIAEACCDWLSKYLDADNVLGIRWLARNMRSNYCGKLMSDTNTFIQEHFERVKESDEFDDLSLEELIEIINDDNLVPDSEEDVVYAVMKWVKFDKDDRLHELPTLLQYTRLEHTSLEFLETLCQDPDIYDNSLCTETIKKAKESFQAQSVCGGREYPAIPLPDRDQGSDHGLDRDLDPGFDRGFDHGFDRSFDCSFDSINESAEPYRPPTPKSLPDEALFRPRRLRQDGRPDMRYKENRDEFLEKGKNMDGRLDRRTKECKEILKQAPKRKDGQPDMRFKVNRDIFLEKGKKKDGSHDMRCRVNKGAPRSRTSSTAPFRSPSRPLKKNGTPDMRFKVNRQLFGDNTSTGSSSQPVQQHRTLGSLKIDGTPDMRYAVNKQVSSTPQCQRSHGGCASSVSYSPARSAGYLKKDGTPDMRYAANKQAQHRGSSQPSVNSVSCSSPDSTGPLKRDGTPDMRFAVNKHNQSMPPHGNSSGGFSSSASLSSARFTGPLKGNGTPDMRYAVNKANYGSSASLDSRSSRSSGISCGSSFATPVKMDGTPDMRYSANKANYGSSASDYSGASYSSGISCGSSFATPSFAFSGPVKRDGTPDMRYAANKASYGSSSSVASGLSGSHRSTRSAMPSYGSSSFTPSGPMKKDGTPDMRYKANRR